MAFTALDVKKLREQTGCGMMDCKKALTESTAILTRLSSICAKRVLPPPRKRQAALPPRAWSTLRPTWQTRWALSSK